MGPIKEKCQKMENEGEKVGARKQVPGNAVIDMEANREG